MGGLRRRQFLAIHPIDLALHERITIACGLLEPRPIDLDGPAPVRRDGASLAQLAHRQSHGRPSHAKQLRKRIVRDRKQVTGNAVVKL